MGLVGRSYRALISIPIAADDDGEAAEIAATAAHSLHPGDGGSGHVELLGEVREGGFRIVRPIIGDPGLLRQLPPDWLP